MKQVPILIGDDGMKKEATVLITLAVLLLSILTLAFNIESVKSEPTTIVVPDNYQTIQEAVNAASPGDTIYVKAGTYYERVEISEDKYNLTLVGENRRTTIIDGNGTRKECIYLYASNVTINGFTMQNTNHAGIVVHWYTMYTSIINNIVLNHPEGITLYSTRYSSIIDNIVSNNTRYGFYIDDKVHPEGGNNTIRGNTVANNRVGIQLLFSNNYSITGNTVSNNNEYGIITYNSHNMKITENLISNNLDGLTLGSSGNNIIHHNNFVNNTDHACISYSSLPNAWDNGYPSGGNYWSNYTDVDLHRGPNQDKGKSDGIWDHPYFIDDNNEDNYPFVHPPWGPIQNVDTDLIYFTIQDAVDASETLAGHTIEVDTGTYYENVVVNKSLALVGEGSGTTTIDGGGTGNVVTVQSNNVQISQFAIQNGETGIYLEYSNDTSVSDNIVSNTDLAIYLLRSSSNTVSDNIVSNNNKGIYLFEYSENNIVSGNTVTNNGYSSTDAGIYLHRSRHNTISGNTISSNTKYGIYLYLSQDTEIIENEISENTHGLRLYNSESSEYNCIIYHNNFINNSEAQASRYGSPYLSSTWDDGYPSGGNYWSDYTGVDEMKGPNQNKRGSDGIGDTPYAIDENNQDNYPLMNP